MILRGAALYAGKAFGKGSSGSPDVPDAPAVPTPSPGDVKKVLPENLPEAPTPGGAKGDADSVINAEHKPTGANNNPDLDPDNVQANNNGGNANNNGNNNQGNGKNGWHQPQKEHALIVFLF